MNPNFIITLAISVGTATVVYLLYKELQKQRRQLNRVMRQTEKLERMFYAYNVRGLDGEDGFGTSEEDLMNMPRGIGGPTPSGVRIGGWNIGSPQMSHPKHSVKVPVPHEGEKELSESATHTSDFSEEESETDEVSTSISESNEEDDDKHTSKIYEQRSQRNSSTTNTPQNSHQRQQSQPQSQPQSQQRQGQSQQHRNIRQQRQDPRYQGAHQIRQQQQQYHHDRRQDTNIRMIHPSQRQAQHPQFHRQDYCPVRMMHPAQRQVMINTSRQSHTQRPMQLSATGTINPMNSGNELRQIMEELSMPEVVGEVVVGVTNIKTTSTPHNRNEPEILNIDTFEVRHIEEFDDTPSKTDDERIDEPIEDDKDQEHLEDIIGEMNEMDKAEVTNDEVEKQQAFDTKNVIKIVEEPTIDSSAKSVLERLRKKKESSKQQRVYVDNTTNRRMGRVGNPIPH